MFLSSLDILMHRENSEETERVVKFRRRRGKWLIGYAANLMSTLHFVLRIRGRHTKVSCEVNLLLTPR